MITRFDQDMDGSICPEEGGRWIRFDDHEAENAALKDRVVQLQGACQLQFNINDTLHLKLQGMQSRSAALVDALTNAQSLMPCQMYKEALALQPSPEILAARDQRVVEACAILATNWGNARLADNGGHALRNCAEAIRTGLWKEYL